MLEVRKLPEPAFRWIAASSGVSSPASIHGWEMTEREVSASEEIQRAALAWPGVTVHPHRFGGVEFRLGKRELGHLHGNAWADIPFPKAIRNELVEAGVAQPHHVLPESGWVSVPIREAADVARVIDLLRRSFELARTRRGNPAPE